MPHDANSSFLSSFRLMAVRRFDGVFVYGNGNCTSQAVDSDKVVFIQLQSDRPHPKDHRGHQNLPGFQKRE